MGRRCSAHAPPPPWRHGAAVLHATPSFPLPTALLDVPQIIDNAIVALYDFERLDGPAAEAVEAEVAKVLKTWWQ